MELWEGRTLENRKRTTHLSVLSDLQTHSASCCWAIWQYRTKLTMVMFLSLIYLHRITAPDSNSAFLHERTSEDPGNLHSKKCLSNIYYLVHRVLPSRLFPDHEIIYCLLKISLWNQTLTSDFNITCSEKALCAAGFLQRSLHIKQQRSDSQQKQSTWGSFGLRGHRKVWVLWLLVSFLN